MKSGVKQHSICPDTSPVPVIPAETLDRIHIYVKLYERPYIRDKVPARMVSHIFTLNRARSERREKK